MQILESANEIKENAADWFDSATDYIETRWNLMLLDVSEKSANTVSSFVTAIVLGIVGAFVLLFLSLGVAWYIGQELNNVAQGYLLVGAFYVVVGAIIYIIKDQYIKIPIINFIIKKFNHGK